MSVHTDALSVVLLVTPNDMSGVLRIEDTLCLISLLSGDATSDASSRLALQGGAVAAWSRGCLVVATWLRVDLVIVDMLFH